MDDLTMVRDLAADVPPPTDDARSAARARLRHAIVQEGRPRPLSRRLMLRVAVAGTAGAAVTGGAVYATRGERGTDSPRMTELSAAQLLHRAADRSRAEGVRLPVPRNDQYVYTRNFITRTYAEGGRKKTWTDESWISVDGSRPSRREEYGKVHDDPPLGEHEVAWPPTEYAKLAKWPTDPAELLKVLRMGRPGADLEAFGNACQFFVVPRVMPPGLEAAVFEAVARIPGIRTDHEAVDGLGRPGVAVTYPELTYSFIFDPRTYAYLGLRLTGSNGGRDKYREMRSRADIAVVDSIGQRP